ncbi:MAG: hypothetical protein OEM49_03495 [Myxococcales bacterium]|nr:hypothetical protein [Myxococcales bacterium]MDH5308066.1 hypothetical protein [Myxococcales bacterium]MDH5567556.1 hypothetical protein [Myxococcales bacterium]
MARKPHAAGETLEEIQDAADRLAEWIREHLVAVVLTVTVLLVVAGSAQLAFSWGERREQDASAALAALDAAYLSAMGAPPGALEVPELANPAAAAAIRSDYVERYAALAQAHAGTVSGALARLQVGALLSTGGDMEGARAAWETLLEEAPDRDALRGMLLQRIAAIDEDAGRWTEAAARHEAAGALRGYPLRHWALVDAARCLAAAGERERALALYERVEIEAPELRLSEHQRAQIDALRAAQQG